MYRSSVYNLKKNFYSFCFFISTFPLIGLTYWYFLMDNTKMYFRFFYILKFFDVYIPIGLDGISFFFILLTSIIVPLCILYNIKINLLESEKIFYFSLFLLIEFLLIQIFLVLDLVWFYILFELLLIPFYFLVAINNDLLIATKKKVNRRLNAFLLLFFYTIVSSFFMLISIILIYLLTGTTNIVILHFSYFNENVENFLWICFFISFGIKIPILPFHLWLPEAHVESPTEVSVLLASIILKVGAYGLLRIVLPVFTYSSVFYTDLVYVLCLFSCTYSSLSAISQTDIKRIMAYSSISHMNIGILGLFSFDLESICGAYILFIGHGFVSGGLFFLIGMLYKRLGTKNTLHIRGLINLFPVFTCIFFLFILFNCSLPGTVNFIGEFLILKTGLSKNLFFFIFFIFISIFCTSIYNFILYNKSAYGVPYNIIKYSKDLTLLEFCVLLPLLLWIFFLGLHPNMVIDLINKDIIFILYKNIY